MLLGEIDPLVDGLRCPGAEITQLLMIGVPKVEYPALNRSSVSKN